MGNKRCALYIRVSTERQAMVEEGSLKNQEEMLKQYIKMKSGISKETWSIVGLYVDRGVSAKDTNRPEYQRMIQDAKDGKVNAVLCIALSRISRSVMDLLNMVDFFNQKDIDFICLKEQFDTTTSQGKCFLTIMAALNQFEREQTSERTSSNMLARAQRGLWNGGAPPLGYDYDKSRKGYLLPNKKESQVVNFLFDTYLENGSVLDTARIANENGYMTKEYRSRRDNHHVPKKFCYSSTLNILSNQKYIGITEINKKNKNKKQELLPKETQYATCKAVWPAIVDTGKFNKVQSLLKVNLKHKNNGAKPKKHSYLFNGGLLSCHKCGSRMEGRNAHGHMKKVYYYYCCVNPACRNRVPEFELELAFQKIVSHVASSPHILEKITIKLNDKLSEQIPDLKKQQAAINGQLNHLRTKTSSIIDKLADVDYGKELIEERLQELDGNKKVLNDRLYLLNSEIERFEEKSVNPTSVKKLLAVLDKVFEKAMKPYQKKKLLQLLLSHLRISDKKLEIALTSDSFRSNIVSVLRTGDLFETTPGSQY